MRRLALLLTVLAALIGSPVAAAELRTSTDREGRTITFDVQAEQVDVEWYAELLRNAAHGPEIERVTIRIVTPEALRATCGGQALGCYGGRKEAARIVLPIGNSPSLSHTVYHEYGHHLDAWRGVAAIGQEPNGSASWAAARGIPELLAAAKVAHDYSLGWEHAIGEIFAEDYAQLHQETPFKISWLPPPTEAIRTALRADLENVPTTPTPVASKPPVNIAKSGTLRTGQPVVVPFELLGPGRRVTFSATLAAKTARARMELRCTDGRSASRVLGGSRRAATIDLGNLGPARCTAALRSTGKVAGRYSTRVRLAVEPAVA
ncbi:MAG: hypothetical protein MSC30_02875 [Gaiellaceae bacterium MAG52_C11]|nr:hypothetical protein [Candidatus Gaiellasilicea maunaloa]